MALVIFIIAGGLMVFLSIFLVVFRMFLSNIIIFYGILAGIAAGLVCGLLWGVHTAFCIVIGVAICAVFIMLHIFKIGFWIITPIMTAAWTGFFGFMAYDISRGDWIWVSVAGCFAALIVLGLHFYARTQLMPSQDNN